MLKLSLRMTLRDRARGTAAMTRAGAILAGVALLACGAARADALADMKAALARMGGTTPLKAQVDTRSWHKQGEGKDADEESGQAGLAVEQGARGLSLTYSPQTLARIDAELRAKAVNPNSKTPTVSALAGLDAGDIIALTSAGAALGRTIERDAFKGERPDTYQGKPARVLTFEAPIATLSENDRKYAKKYLSQLEVWIGADGMPLASRARMTLSGRAFVVISFDMRHDEDSVFITAGDHLLVARKESHDHGSGAGEKGERKVVTTLQLVP